MHFIDQNLKYVKANKTKMIAQLTFSFGIGLNLDDTLEERGQKRLLSGRFLLLFLLSVLLFFLGALSSLNEKSDKLESN